MLLLATWSFEQTFKFIIAGAVFLLDKDCRLHHSETQVHNSREEGEKGEEGFTLEPTCHSHNCAYSESRKSYKQKTKNWPWAVNVSFFYLWLIRCLQFYNHSNSNTKFQGLSLSIANLVNIISYPIVWRKIRVPWQSRKATAGRQMSMKKQRISAPSLAKLFTGNCNWFINCLGLNLCLYINQRLWGNL